MLSSLDENMFAFCRSALIDFFFLVTRYLSDLSHWDILLGHLIFKDGSSFILSSFDMAFTYHLTNQQLATRRCDST